MAAHDNVNKYQFHRTDMYRPSETNYHVYKGHQHVAELTVDHPDVYDESADPKTWNVGYMRVGKGHRHIAPTLLGVAQVDAIAEGTSLTPSSDLSPHSSRLVRNLKGRGLVAESATDMPSNDIDLRTPWHAYPDERVGKRLNTEQVQEGRNYIRQAIKRKKS